MNMIDTYKNELISWDVKIRYVDQEESEQYPEFRSQEAFLFLIDK